MIYFFFFFVNSAEMKIGVHVPFSILVSLRYTPRRGIAGSYIYIYFLRNLHSVFLSGCINLYFHKQCKNVPFSLLLLYHLLFGDFLMMAILTSVR